MKVLKTRRSRGITHIAGKAAGDFAAVALARPVCDVEIRKPVGEPFRVTAEAVRA